MAIENTTIGLFDTTPPELDHYKCDCSDFQSVVSPGAYLADLLDYATRTLQRDGEPVDLDRLESLFHQPFRELPGDEDAATDTVRQARICTEILIGHLHDEEEMPTADTTAEYRRIAYETLLDEWGVTRTDLRNATSDPEEREWVADSVGIADGRVDDLWLQTDPPIDREYDPIVDDEYPLSEANLEAIFGLPALMELDNEQREPTDPIRTIETPHIRMWRREQLRDDWREDDFPDAEHSIHLDDSSNALYPGEDISETAERPALDPDLVGPDDFRHVPSMPSRPSGSNAASLAPDSRSAFPATTPNSLWEHRRTWVDDELKRLWGKTPAGADSDSDIDVPGLLNEMIADVSYRNTGRGRAWYPGLSSAPPQVPAQGSGGGGSQSDDPLAGQGFLDDFVQLYRQVTADGEAARTARASRQNSQYPTGDPSKQPGAAATAVIEDHLNLDRAAFVRLVELLRTAFAEGETLNEDEWWEVTSILVGARKRSLDAAWISEEESKGLHFDRKAFWRSRRTPSQGEWSFRENRHADGEPFIDPERESASDLPERPHGATAQQLYEDRQSTLASRRERFVESIERERRALAGEFETMASTIDSELQRLRNQQPSSGSVPDSLAKQSPLDPVLDNEFGSISWPAVSGDWEARFQWIAEGLDLRDKSNPSSSEQDHIQKATAKLEELQLWEPAFDKLRTLRQQAKPWVGRSDGGLDDSQLTTVFRLLPTGNPLDPVLTTVYDAKQNSQELGSVYGSNSDRWAQLVAETKRKLEASSGGSQSSTPPELDVLGLSSDEFERLLTVRRAAVQFGEDAGPSDAAITEIVAILTTIWKELEFYDENRSGNWITEEKNDGVTDYWNAYKARLPKWRASSDDRSAWRQALLQRSAAPIVDPDLITDVDAFEEPAWHRSGYDIWRDRDEFLAGKSDAMVPEVAILRDDAAADNRKSESERRQLLSDNLTRVVGISLSEVVELGEAIADGEDVGVRVGRLDLTPAALSYLLGIDERQSQRPITAEEWRNVANILRGVWKQRQYGRWRREERAHDVFLEPDQFDLPDEGDEPEPPGEDDPVRWRVTWTVRDEWEDLLDARIDAFDEVDERIEESVAAAEQAAMPTYRDALIERIDDGPEPPAKAEWLSERFLIDTEMYGGMETTRVSQAITSLQTLFQSLDIDLGADAGGLAQLALTIEDDHFDERWQWLGTYGKWKSAMGVYIYPENVLLPSMRDRTTGAFDEISGTLARRQSLTRETVSEQVNAYREYMEDLIWLHPEAGTMVAPEETPDSEVPLAYTIARSGTNPDRYYYTAFVPDDDTATSHADSTWDRIPAEHTESIDRVIGADTYRGEVYLFTTTTEGGSQSDEEGGEQGEGSGGSYKRGLQYLRYDVREGSWDAPQEIDLPDGVSGDPLEIYMGAQGAASGTNEVAADDIEVNGIFEIEMVQNRADDQGRPTLLLVLRLQAPDQTHYGDPIEQLFYYPLTFDRDGAPPELDDFPTEDLIKFAGGYIVTNEMLKEFGGDSWFNGFILAATRDYDEIDVFTEGWIDRLSVRSYSGNSLIEDPHIEEILADELDSVEFEHPHDSYYRVLQRPTQNELIIFPESDDSVYGIPWNGRYGDYREYDVDDLDPYPSVLCNNAIDLPNRGEAGSEVFIGTADFGNKFTDPPAQIGMRFDDGDPPALSTEATMALAPPFDRSMGESGGFYDDEVDPWQYGPHPDDLLSESGNYEGRFERTAQKHRANAQDLLDRTTDLTRVYVREGYYSLPLFLGRQLTQAGDFQTALEWFRTVYEYSSDADDRAIWPPLAPEQAGKWGADNPEYGWLRDPIEPHSIAETRSNPYLKFTLFSIVQCLLDYADDQYAQDTAETVANATQLYEEALDFLDLDALVRTGDPCHSLLDRLDTLIDEYVIGPEIWAEDETLTEAEVRLKVDAMVDAVEGIPDYTDRREAVNTIESFLDDGEFRKALEEANEWEEREPDPYKPEEDNSDVYWPILGVDFVADQLAKTASLLNSLYTPTPILDTGVFGSTVEPVNVMGSAGQQITPVTTANWVPTDQYGISETNIDAVALSGNTATTTDTQWTDVTDVTADGGTSTVDPRVASASMDILQPTRNEFCVPRNGYKKSLERHAEVNLQKIRDGRNIAGMKRDLDPYSAPTSIESATPSPGSIGATAAGLDGSAQPTNYRYETLLDRAKEIAGRAKEFEAEFLRVVEKSEREEFKLKKAKQQVELAEERVSLQELRLNRAEDKVELARLRREKARIRRNTYSEWVETGQLAETQIAQFMLLQSANLQSAAAIAHLAAAALNFGAASTSATPASVMSSIAGGFSSIAAAMSAQAGAISTRSQVLQMQAAHRRRKRQWDLQKTLAQKDYEIGSQRITIARDTVDIVEQEREIAELKIDQAEDIVNFHENKFTNEALYDWMAQVLKNVYRFFLQQATATARMAQRQLAFERQELPRQFIKTDYWEAPSEGGTAIQPGGDDSETDRQGMTGSARLLRDIYEMDQHEFETAQRRLEVEETISVAELDPIALQRFRETGVLSFATDLEVFQWRHPGQYHRLIETVDVDVIALTPPTEGINATLRNGGTSRVVTGGTMFSEETIDRDPEKVVLNRAQSRENRVRMTPEDREMLRPFENSGVATDWEFRMPRAANDMDYETVADVQLTIRYTALESYDYRQQVIGKFDEERTVEQGFSFHDSFGDAWYELNNAEGERTVTFETDREDFPSNLSELDLDELQLYLVGPTGDEREQLKDIELTLRHGNGSNAEGRPTNGTLEAGSSFAGDDPEQEWELTVTPAGGRDPFADDTIEDILLVVSAEGQVPNWPR